VRIGNYTCFFSDGWMTAITDVGLKATGERKKVYDGWKYPDNWVVEGFCQEAPKLILFSALFCNTHVTPCKSITGWRIRSLSGYQNR